MYRSGRSPLKQEIHKSQNWSDNPKPVISASAVKDDGTDTNLIHSKKQDLVVQQQIRVGLRDSKLS